MILSRRDVLVASVVAFIAWGLLVKWLPLLRFLGYAFVAGMVIASGALLALILTSSRPLKVDRSQDEVEGVHIAILLPEVWKKETSILAARQAFQPKQLYPQSFVISQALDNLIMLALRNFVTSWYKNITRSPAFVNEIERNIRIAVIDLRDRIFTEDLVAICVQRLVPIITTHMHDFDQAEKAVRGKSLNRNITESEELDMAIAAKYRDGKLHPAASLAFSDTRTNQQDHLRKILVRLLPELLPASVMTSRSVSVLIKEIVACAILFPIMHKLTEPDFWNQLVEAYGRTTLQDRKTVQKMRAALDQHASPSKNNASAELPHLAPNDSERTFERFVRVIRKTNNLADARRYRSTVTSQLKRESMVEGQDQTYLRRLETAKRVLDQKVARLNGVNGVSGNGMSPSEGRRTQSAFSRDLSLVQIMHTASGLSYFMEYMDRQRLMTLVQFWVVVDGFRNPLEDDFGDDETYTVTWKDSDRMDVAQISEAYMNKSELKISDESKVAIKTFLVAGRKATTAQYRAARTAILSAQSAVLDELQQTQFPSFKKSDLYYKFLATDEAASPATNALLTLSAPNHLSLPVDPVQRSASPTMTKTRSHQSAKRQDLRRAALSSSDLPNMVAKRTNTEDDFVRRSVDSGRPSPLFDDDYDNDPLANSTMSFGNDSFHGESDQGEIIEHMEAAMNDIMTDSPQDTGPDHDSDALFGSPTVSIQSPAVLDSPRPSLETTRSGLFTDEKQRPNLATLGLVNTSSRIGVFSDNDLFPDEEKFIEDEYADSDDPQAKTDAEESVHEAGPGDLGLAEAVAALTTDIERLVSQDSIVDTLTRKAELTNNVAELRILGKSKASLQREIRRKELQRQQYIVQESDNSLFGRSSVRIKSVMVGREEDGREFALYVIEVQRQAGDQMVAATWAIARRYSEFHDLHQKLRRSYPSTRALEFPRRRVVMKLQKQFLHNRKVALENYLQQLLSMPDVCRSHELRSFLSQQAILAQNETSSGIDAQDIVARIYNSVTDGMDDFLGNAAVLDQLSLAGQNLMSAATNQIGATTISATSDPTLRNDITGILVTGQPGGSVAEAEAELQAFEDRNLEPFVKPICDLFLETFSLGSNRGNTNWLRGRAVVVVLHQLLGGTVERKIRDTMKSFTTEDVVLRYVDMLKGVISLSTRSEEDGNNDTDTSSDQNPPKSTNRSTNNIQPPAAPRTPAQKLKSKKEAGLMLLTLVPDLAANVVGRANAQMAAKRILAVMNNERLNEHLAFTILDEVVGVLLGAR